MTSLWLPADHMKIRKYSAAANGSNAVVKIEIEVTSPTHLGYLLSEIAEAKCRIEQERKAKVQAARQAKKSQKEKPRAIGQKKTLALPFYGGDQS